MTNNEKPAPRRVELPEELLHWYNVMLDAKRREAEAKAEKEEARDELMSQLGDNVDIVMYKGVELIHIERTAPRYFNEREFKEHYPELHEQFKAPRPQVAIKPVGR